MKGYADLAVLPEDERIRIIGEYAMQGNIVGISLEDDAVKIERYIEKITEQFPDLRHIDTTPIMATGSMLVRISLKADQ